MSRSDGSWDNYPLSRRARNCKLKQGFPSGSSPAQVSEQLMTFRSNGMKEMAVVCSQLHTSFLLLSAVCLNLPVFTPQGDHVIRSHPQLVCHLAALLLQRRRTAGTGKKTKQNNINSQEATTSNVHHLVALSLLYDHYSCRNHTGLICFSFCDSPPSFKWMEWNSLFSLHLNTHCSQLYTCIYCIYLRRTGGQKLANYNHNVLPYWFV